MKRAVAGLAILGATILTVMALPMTDKVVCKGDFRIGRAYHYEYNPFRVVKDGYMAFLCETNGRIYLTRSDGKEYLLPEKVEGLWYVSGFHDDYVNFYYACQGMWGQYRFTYETQEVSVVNIWYEPSYIYASEECV